MKVHVFTRNSEGIYVSIPPARPIRRTEDKFKPIQNIFDVLNENECILYGVLIDPQRADTLEPFPPQGITNIWRQFGKPSRRKPSKKRFARRTNPLSTPTLKKYSELCTATKLTYKSVQRALFRLEEKRFIALDRKAMQAQRGAAYYFLKDVETVADRYIEDGWTYWYRASQSCQIAKLETAIDATAKGPTDEAQIDARKDTTASDPLALETQFDAQVA